MILEVPGTDPDTVVSKQRSGIALEYQQRQKLEALVRSGWRLSPATMGHKLTQGRWVAAKHLLYISNMVTPAIARGGARILVTMPPRHGKSEFLSVNTPVWHLETRPTKQIIQVSYGLELVTDFTVRVRDTFLDEDLHQLLKTRISKAKRRSDNFKTTKLGGVIGAGVGGPITGRGADLMLIDDYIKNAEAALSLGQRESAWEWFKSTAFTRLEPGSSLIVLATRWDQDDLVGRMQTLMPGQNWIVINLPAIAVANDPLGREPGEPLWPERYNLEALMEIKEALGTYWWEAMYQQNPLPSMSGANLGNKLKVCRMEDMPHPNTLKWVRAWDLAATEGGGDATAGVLMGFSSETKKFYIFDIQHFRKSSYGIELMLQATAQGDGYGKKIWMEQEPGSAGKIVIDHIAKTVLRGYDVSGDKPSGKIEVRAQPFLAAVEAGNVYCAPSEHLEQFKTELNGFPDGDHDDLISAGALAHTKLTGARFGGVIWGNDDRGSKHSHVYTPNTNAPRITGAVW